MDIATLIGLVAALGSIVIAMLLGGSPGGFVDAPSLVLVLGGTLATTLVQQRLSHFVGALCVARNAFLKRPGVPERLIPAIVALAQKARKEGLVSLEGEPISDAFLARGIRLGVDGLGPELVAMTLESELVALRRRHEAGHKTFRFMAGTAPSMGMIGTLVGLVQMLRTLDDPQSLGPAMAVALLTTFYGAVLAFLVFHPIAEKLENCTAEEVALRRMVIAGVTAILEGDNSMAIESKLEAFLAPGERPRTKRR